MQWFSFLSGITVGTLAGTVISAFCHVAADSDREENREKAAPVKACAARPHVN